MKVKTEKDLMNKLFQENGLTEDDIFSRNFKGGQKMTIITRTGIEKIKAKNNINVTYEVVCVTPSYCAVKAIGQFKESIEETFGSACKETSDNKYYLEMAEKRALSRVVLKLTKLYEIKDLIGEDEQDTSDKTTKIGNIKNL